MSLLLTCRWYTVWDHIDSHHKFLADEVKYPILKENITAFFATKAEMFHIQPRGDPLFAFKAPITELVKGTVKDLKDKAELEEILAAMSSTTGIEGHHGTIWGSVVEEDGSYVLLAGWDSVQVSSACLPATKLAPDFLHCRPI